MKKFYFIFLKILPLIFLLSRQSFSQKRIEILVYKIKYHTGMLIELNESVKKSLSAAKDFPDHKFIDVGWGDEDFYQRENFNPYYATKAIVVPTSSVIRLRGLNGGSESIIQESDFCIRFELTQNQFAKLINFIDKSFLYDEKGDVVRTSARKSFSIVFYKSVQRYHIFNTCNTWVAEALKNAELPVSTFMIITGEDVYDEISEVGDVLKKEKKRRDEH